MADQQHPPLAVVILAAGQGTRMRSATPKLLHTLAGVTLVGHVLATAEELGPSHIVAVVRHERDRMVQAIHEQSPSVVVVEQDEVPGTGRAVQVGLSALPEGFDGVVVVLSADVPMLDAATLREAIDNHRAAANALTLLSAYVDDPGSNGRILRDSSGAFLGIVEHRDANPEQLQIVEINGGVYVFEASHLRSALEGITTENAQSELYLTDAAAAIHSAGGAIAAIPVSDPWLVAGINDRVQLSAAALELNARIVRGWQLAGVTVHDPASTWVDLKTTLNEDVELLPGTQLRGATIVDRGAIIGPDTTLVDCEVGEWATVKRTDATLAVIGPRASVGPFAYLRPGTYLGADGKIGTFVETKNSTIGAGSKVPHLSYIGDTTIGERTNIGAGAITANYDDLEKHTTTIGSHVHTVSHTVFVAPVTIGDAAKTGAGAVIRKPVPPGALAISVAPQRNLQGWVQEHRAGTDAAKAADEAAS
jgi:bifunctional UDP-N-acetylglucosamine pyrophosphorylase/glucosamine-1-phosphate N-acetyltransferase